MLAVALYLCESMVVGVAEKCVGDSGSASGVAKREKRREEKRACKCRKGGKKKGGRRR